MGAYFEVLLEGVQRVVLLQVVVFKVLDDDQDEQVQHDERTDQDEAKEVHRPEY